MQETRGHLYCVLVHHCDSGTVHFLRRQRTVVQWDCADTL